MNLNYLALHDQVTEIDVQLYEQAYGGRQNSKRDKTIIVIILIFSGLILWMALASKNMGLLVITAVYTLPFFWLRRHSFNRKKKLVRLYKFASANNLKLITDKQTVDYAGIVFSQGYNQKINEAFLLPNGSEIGNYQYTVGTGRNRRTYYWGYMRIKLKRHLPNMLLDSKKNNFINGKFSNLPQLFDKSQVVKLEGDFNNYFTLYLPKGYEKDAFYILTPDVMVALIDHGAHFDMEVVDDMLYFYRASTFKLESEEEIRSSLAVLGSISTELIDQTDYYADERVGNRASDMISAPGRRLKKRTSWVVITFIIVYLMIAFSRYI